MALNETIRKYRKLNHMTQEEVAQHLGVSASAVNKWEMGNSCPDIMLLAPIARLFHISLDTLLCFEETLDQNQINEIIEKVYQKLQQEPFEEVFSLASDIVAQHPTCEALLWQVAVLLNGERERQEISNTAFEKTILSWYQRVLRGTDSALRLQAANSLFYYYLRKKDYSHCEECLSYFSEENPQRKQKQAQLFEMMGKNEDAYRTYEELLFSSYGLIDAVLNDLQQMAMNKDESCYQLFVQKRIQLATLFEMGSYYENTCQLEALIHYQKEEELYHVAKEMLESMDHIDRFSESKLYQHMKFKSMDPSFIEEMRTNLIRFFLDESQFSFIKNKDRWRRLIQDFAEDNNVASKKAK